MGVKRISTTCKTCGKYLVLEKFIGIPELEFRLMVYWHKLINHRDRVSTTKMIFGILLIVIFLIIGYILLIIRKIISMVTFPFWWIHENI